MKNRAATMPKVIRTSILLIMLLFIIMVVSVLMGPAKVSIYKGLNVLLGGWSGGFSGASSSERMIIMSIRLPRVIFAAVVGAALSTAGVVFQALLRNPLAEPYILGISGGAAVGAIIGMMIGAASLPFGISSLAFAGAILTVVLVFLIGRSRRGIESNTILLSGVIINAFFQAVIMFFISVSSSKELHSISFWLMGNLGIAEVKNILAVLIFSLSAFVLIYLYARHLNLIVIGEETALQLGVNVERTKVVLFLAASIMTGLAVSFSGIIGFVGLIIPHVARMIFGNDHRILLPSTFLIGASFLVIADTVARTAVPHSELPVGVVTAMCGAPYFICLLRRKVA